MNSDENLVSSSTGIDRSTSHEGGSHLLVPPQVSGEACSMNVSFRGRSTKNIDVIYTDLFLDVINYDRDKQIFFKKVLNVAVDDTLLLVCSAQMYRFLLNAEQGSDVLNGGNVYLCDAVTGRNASGGMLPERPNRLVTFNVDPFDVAVSVRNKADSGDDVSKPSFRLRRAFKMFMATPDPPADGSTRIELVHNVFVMNERSIQAFSATEKINTNINARLEFVNDHANADTTRNIMCNYCSDVMVCVQNDMTTIHIEGNMPLSADASMTLDPKNLIVLVTSIERLNNSPDAEYFRFKQFYHTFAYGTNNKWGIIVEGSTLWRYICSLTTGLTIEMERLFNVLKRTASKEFYKDRVRLGPGDKTTSTDGQEYLVDSNELDQSEYMENARHKVFRAYMACPILLNTVDMKSITMVGRDCFETSLMREHATLRSNHQPISGMDAYIKSIHELFDSATYPAGGDIFERSVIEALQLETFTLNGSMVVRSFTDSSNSKITYNKYFMNLLFNNN